MKKIGWLFLLLIIPQSNVFGCQVCVKGFINLAFPFMIPSLIPLLIWRIIYGFFQWKSNPQLPPKTIRKYIIQRILIICGLFLLAYEGGIFIYLFSSFLKSLYQLFKNRREFLKLKYSKQMLLVHFCIFIILSGLATKHYYRESQLDTLNLAREYTFGGGPERGFILKIAKDPNFEINRLTPMLKQSHITFSTTDILFKT